MVDATPLLTAMDRAGYRMTEPRRTVSALVADRVGHFTAADLVDDARAGGFGIGRATVFRTLEVMLALGLVERLDLPSGDHAYVHCAGAHHHHVVCTSCGRTSEIADAGLRTLLRSVERQTGYRVDDHRIELFGACASCRSAELDA